MIPADRREFLCTHCDGKILIPLDLPPTTGPCPHCSGVITSPEPLAEIQLAPPPQPVEQPAAVAPPVNPPAAPRPVEKAPPPPPEAPAPKPVSIPEPREKVEPPPPVKATEPKIQKEKPAPKASKPARSGLFPALLVLLVLGLAAGGIIYFAANKLKQPAKPPAVTTKSADTPVNEANYIRIGWQNDAYELLRGYMAATDTQGKTPFILNGETLAAKIEEFYGGSRIVDSDTPADSFSVYELSEEDRKRGLFMMIYDQPPQFEMKEFFRPLASLEVQYGVDEADLLLSTFARVGNFAMEPLRVHAFFRRTSEGLKLDWEIFAQTKYRRLQNFVELPEVGQTGVFRVLIVEDVPDKGRAVAGTRTYRVADPANTGDTARVNVRVDSESGRALSQINWRGTKENRPITRTATVELKWSGEPAAPELEISRFICWEFLGLGGRETPSTASTK